MMILSEQTYKFVKLPLLTGYKKYIQTVDVAQVW